MSNGKPERQVAAFSIGQIVHHRLFDYRGVIYDVDPAFAGTEEWYEQHSKTRSPKDRPWYHVLVHDTVSTTYVAERNLEPDDTDEPVRHPLLDQVLERAQGGHYTSRDRAN
ncbi:MAG TPA: heat shock protein HspQ [Sneathiellales bacterium]|nr:heat shock protein HspQ [Sneathiellales bacterium]